MTTVAERGPVGPRAGDMFGTSCKSADICLADGASPSVLTNLRNLGEWSTPPSGLRCQCDLWA